MTLDTTPPSETTAIHTRLLKCSLEIEDARAYWSHRDPHVPPTAQAAFDGWWFSGKSLNRTSVLLSNFQARFDAFPHALEVLRRWRVMDPTTRALICHWHAQLADPMYRVFTGAWLAERRLTSRPEVTLDLVVGWVTAQGPGRWTMTTRLHFASKLLSSALAAGLVGTNRDPRPLRSPRVDDDALGYLLHLLRGVRFEGTLLDNPYLRSVGLDSHTSLDRVRALDGVHLQRQGDLIDLTWDHNTLLAWATARGLWVDA